MSIWTWCRNACAGTRRAGAAGAPAAGNAGSGFSVCALITIAVIFGGICGFLYYFGPTIVENYFTKQSSTAKCGSSTHFDDNDKPDKTGLADLALESLGGQIVSIRNTVPVRPKIRYQFLGLPLVAFSTPPPETIIRYAVDPVPGVCWGFEGGQGSIVIKLSQPARITCFHLEHIHKRLDPRGLLADAPHEFRIWGLGDFRCLKSGNRVLLGNYTFTPQVTPLQFFETETTEVEFDQLELEVLSNHGSNATCIYRIRVHGDINSSDKVSPCKETETQSEKIETGSN